MIKKSVHWSWRRFPDLELQQWHDLLQLRINVFVVEQDCPYPELDGKDPLCIHILGILEDKIVATARILPPGLSYREVSIGRVAVQESLRGSGLGRELMMYCLKVIDSEYGTIPVRISAQTYLKDFYTGLGFQDTGHYYEEDNIPHLEMIKPTN